MNVVRKYFGSGARCFPNQLSLLLSILEQASPKNEQGRENLRLRADDILLRLLGFRTMPEALQMQKSLEVRVER
jgi:hypothetical protein